MGNERVPSKKNLRRNISKTSVRVSSGFQTRETFETTRPQAEWFYCFRAFGNLMKPEAFLKIISHTHSLLYILGITVNLFVCLFFFSCITIYFTRIIIVKRYWFLSRNNAI